MSTKRFQIIVRAIIKDNYGNILLLKRSKEPEKDKWSLPGGKVDFGEESPKAIIREIKEELDINFTPTESFLLDDFKSISDFHCLVIHYYGTWQGVINLLYEENFQYHFFSKKETQKSSEIAFNHKEVLLEHIFTKAV